MRIVIDAVVAMAVEEIKAPLERQVALRLAHVPFADRAVAVAGGTQEVADRLLLRIEAQRHLR
jgi:ATP phosphoribosyltransferase regulatory subunit HisZ